MIHNFSIFDFTFCPLVHSSTDYCLVSFPEYG